MITRFNGKNGKSRFRTGNIRNSLSDQLALLSIEMYKKLSLKHSFRKIHFLK